MYIVNQVALSSVGTCKSGERRVGTRPNDSSPVVYKYSRAGSTRLLLLVAKKPGDNRVSRCSGKAFNSHLTVFQSWEPHTIGVTKCRLGPGMRWWLQLTSLPVRVNREEKEGIQPNIYSDRKQFTYQWSEHSSQVSPSDKHTVGAQDWIHRRPQFDLPETWPSRHTWEQELQKGVRVEANWGRSLCDMSNSNLLNRAVM